MFSLLSKVTGYFWPDEEEDEDEQASALAKNLNFRNQEKDVKYESGKVTSIHNGYGLINKDVYFEFKAVSGGTKPRVGDDVNMTVCRSDKNSGWRATSVTVCHSSSSEWTDRDKGGTGIKTPVIIKPSLSTPLHSNGIKKETNSSQMDEKGSPTTPRQVATVGIVSRTSKDSGFLNDTIPFNFSDVRHGYTPYQGDWVKADVVTDPSTDEVFAINICPLREQCFDGQVNSLQQGFGYIDQEIYFTFSACAKGFVPVRGQRVTGTAIEYTRGRSAWRATSVEPKAVPLLNTAGNTASSKLQSPSPGGFLTKLFKDKQGISVSESLQFSQLLIGQEKTYHIWIKNSGEEPQLFIECHVQAKTEGQFSLGQPEVYTALHQKTDITATPISIQSGMTVYIPVVCKARNPGHEKQLLIIAFEGFKIGRYLSVKVTDPAQGELVPGAPYERTPVLNRYKAGNQRSVGGGWTIPGVRPMRFKTKLQLPNRLPQFPIPQDLRECLFEEKDLACFVSALGESLSQENYLRRFSTLLHLEEIQMEIDIREFDLERECLRRCGEFLALRVPGLAEGRPSVLVGDRVILSVPQGEQGGQECQPQYEGYVHEVLSEEVLLKFHFEFHSSYNDEAYDVQFTFNRTPVRRSHQAVKFASEGLNDEVLFPEKLEPKLPQNLRSQRKQRVLKPEELLSPVKASEADGLPSPRGLSMASGHKFFNPQLNHRQRTGVLRILAGQCRPLPYILFGPPGTGKTVTLVEAILQVFHHLPSSRIIACAPSNSAADLLAERLHMSGQVKQGDMVRLNAFARVAENIPACIERYCSDAENLELVARHRILVSTCVSAGTMYALGLKPGHFTHAFIDEAGQSTEPESLISIGLVAGPEGQVVLAGDPMQLGPVLRSRPAQNYGLGQSFLERLINMPLYARDERRFADHGCYDPLLVTKLVDNYRSHPTLLKLPSQLFYHDELRVKADKTLTECLSNWSMLPNQNGCPLIFHGMRGEDLREGNSPSWFNAAEAVQVMRYLQNLLYNDVHPLSYHDIGIITPYRKQVEKIRILIDGLGMEKVKVGSVEEFQGQERPVMIISTVRSQEHLVGFDVRHNLGFLSNPKRFNVAITRAQALLIIIGNPHVLAQDGNWLALVQYCVSNGAYIGCDLPANISQNLVTAKEEQEEEEEEEEEGEVQEEKEEDEEFVCQNVNKENLKDALLEGDQSENCSQRYEVQKVEPWKDEEKESSECKDSDREMQKGAPLVEDQNDNFSTFCSEEQKVKAELGKEGGVGEEEECKVQATNEEDLMTELLEEDQSDSYSQSSEEQEQRSQSSQEQEIERLRTQASDDSETSNTSEGSDLSQERDHYENCENDEYSVLSAPAGYEGLRHEDDCQENNHSLKQMPQSSTYCPYTQVSKYDYNQIPQTSESEDLSQGSDLRKNDDFSQTSEPSMNAGNMRMSQPSEGFPFIQDSNYNYKQIPETSESEDLSQGSDFRKNDDFSRASEPSMYTVDKRKPVKHKRWGEVRRARLRDNSAGDQSSQDGANLEDAAEPQNDGVEYRTDDNIMGQWFQYGAKLEEVEELQKDDVSYRKKDAARDQWFQYGAKLEDAAVHQKDDIGYRKNDAARGQRFQYGAKLEDAAVHQKDDIGSTKCDTTKSKWFQYGAKLEDAADPQKDGVSYRMGSFTAAMLHMSNTVTEVGDARAEGTRESRPSYTHIGVKDCQNYREDVPSLHGSKGAEHSCFSKYDSDTLKMKGNGPPGGEMANCYSIQTGGNGPPGGEMANCYSIQTGGNEPPGGESENYYSIHSSGKLVVPPSDMYGHRYTPPGVLDQNENNSIPFPTQYDRLQNLTKPLGRGKPSHGVIDAQLGSALKNQVRISSPGEKRGNYDLLEYDNFTTTSQMQGGDDIKSANFKNVHDRVDCHNGVPVKPENYEENSVMPSIDQNPNHYVPNENSEKFHKDISVLPPGGREGYQPYSPVVPPSEQYQKLNSPYEEGESSEDDYDYYNFEQRDSDVIIESSCEEELE